MENESALRIGEEKLRMLTSALEKGNELSSRYGMSLSLQEMRMLAAGRERALQDTGRVEFGVGPLPALIEAFCDSPYMDRQNYADTLLELQDAFYYFKNESEGAFSDDELIEAMKRVFDGRAQGSTEYLEGLSPEELYRVLTGREEDE